MRGAIVWMGQRWVASGDKWASGIAIWQFIEMDDGAVEEMV